MGAAGELVIGVGITFESCAGPESLARGAGALLDISDSQAMTIVSSNAPHVCLRSCGPRGNVCSSRKRGFVNSAILLASDHKVDFTKIPQELTAAGANRSYRCAEV